MPVPQKTPGVYVDEVSSGSHPIAGVATSITAFIGATRRGALKKPVRVASFAEFETRFGGLAPGLETGYAVKQFFDNGGTTAWVVRVAKNATARQLVARIQALNAVDLFNLLVLPGVSDADVVTAAADYCQQRRAFLFVDAPAAAKSPAQMAQVVTSGAMPKSSFAAVYYPWLKIADPLQRGQTRVVAPSGTIAGVIAQNDATRGVWKAPANVGMQGVQGLDHDVTETDSRLLTPLGVNCLRSFAGRGLLVWGARTLAGADAADADWKYIPVRRLALFIEESIDRGTKWAVFEPNAEPLWLKLRDSVENFLTGLWREGALQGSKPEAAFFVNCGLGTTMTQEDVDAGRLTIVIGLAVVHPAEFIIIRIGQQLCPP